MTLEIILSNSQNQLDPNVLFTFVPTLLLSSLALLSPN